MLAVAVTSACVNGPIKLVANRRRPNDEQIPIARRLARVPTSSSFPSGHTASAVAFATAVGLEIPAAAAPLGALAAGVGVSRISTGVHYPLDVAAGAALGATAAALVRGVAERRREPAPAERLAPARHLEIGAGRDTLIVVNPSSGPALARSPSDALRDAFPEAKLVDADGSTIDAARSSLEPSTRALIVAGGDGSIGALAALAQERRIPLGIVPSGTMNHLARDLGIDDLGTAIEAIRSGAIAHVDLALIAGRPFVNTASFAAYAELVDARTALESKIGKWPAALAALTRVSSTDPVSVEIDGRTMRIWAIFIGNGRYSPGLVPSSRMRLDDGRFDVRVLRADRRYPRLRALASGGPRRLQGSSAFEAWTCRRLEIRSLDGPLRLASDGETFDGPDRFAVEKSPEPLAVFVP